jgi:peroxiredoxin
VTRDTVDVLDDYAARETIGYTLLSDTKSEIIGAFGLINEQMPRGSAWYGIARPAIFAIDPKGVISHRFTTRDYRDRPDPALVLEELRKGAGG